MFDMTDTRIAFARKGVDLEPPVDEPREHLRLVATAELHQLGGNQRPYFSVTGEVVNTRYNRGSDRFWVSAGYLHDEILDELPTWAPLVALHLADDRGWPMYAVENGAYFLGFTKYQEHNGQPLPGIGIFAKLWRITESEAADARAYAASYVVEIEGKPGPIRALEVLALACAPRWQAEADAGRTLIEDIAKEVGQ